MTEKSSINNNKHEDTQLSTDLLTKFFEQINKKLDDIKDEVSSFKTETKLNNKDFENKIENHENRIGVLEVDKKDKESKIRTWKTQFSEISFIASSATVAVFVTAMALLALFTVLGVNVGNILAKVFGA
jgi:predicted RNase H-like nuclease (RuvC/YqgF family)